jgi:hypothetical protein
MREGGGNLGGRGHGWVAVGAAEDGEGEREKELSLAWRQSGGRWERGGRREWGGRHVIMTNI